MKKIIAGVDEVGRGSLVGPVYAAAVILNKKINTKLLKEHISIIHPKILVLMGSTAMEAILGINKKISQERGQWKEIIIRKESYKVIVTFHPAYLLRKPDQKKFSWEDLKIIRKEIDNQDIII